MPEELTLLPCPACCFCDYKSRCVLPYVWYVRALLPKGRYGICDQAMERPAPSADVDDRAAEGTGVVLDTQDERRSPYHFHHL